MDVLDLLERSTAWTKGKIAGAQDQLDAATPCDAWTVRVLINHLIAVQQMFAAGPSGGTIAPPSGDIITAPVAFTGGVFLTPAAVRELEKGGRQLLRIVPERILL